MIETITSNNTEIPANAADRRSSPEKTQAWRTRIDEQLASGLSVRKYCDLHRLKVSTFTYWKRKLKKPAQNDDSPSSRFDQFSAGQLTTAIARQDAPRDRVEIILNDFICIRVAPDFDEQTILRLVNLLSSVR